MIMNELLVFVYIVCFFFFQAEDGIRDIGVTGVQTCALPIFMDVAGHRIGLFLGREVLPPAAGLDGCPNMGLEITRAGLRRVAARLADEGVPLDRKSVV